MKFISINNYIINLNTVTTVNIDNDAPSNLIFHFVDGHAAYFTLENEDDALDMIEYIIELT
jgi:hypothetical protein